MASGARAPGARASGGMASSSQGIKDVGVCGCQVSRGRRPVISLWKIPPLAGFSPPCADPREGACSCSHPSLPDTLVQQQLAVGKWRMELAFTGQPQRRARVFSQQVPSSSASMGAGGSGAELPWREFVSKAKLTPLATVCLALPAHGEKSKRCRLSAAGGTRAQARGAERQVGLQRSAPDAATAGLYSFQNARQ